MYAREKQLLKKNSLLLFLFTEESGRGRRTNRWRRKSLEATSVATKAESMKEEGKIENPMRKFKQTTNDKMEL